VGESAVTLSNTGATVIDLTGSLAGSGNLLINGGGGFVLGGAVANTFSGLITVSHGDLMLNKSAGVNAIAGNVTVQGGLATAASLTVAASHQIANNAAVSVGAYGSFGFSGSGLTETIGSLTNSGGTFITGANTLIGSGNSITWSGGTNTVSAGGTLTDAHFLISGGTNTVDGGTTRGTLEVASGGSGLELGGVASPVLTLSSHATQAGRILLSGDVSVLSTLTTGTAQILSGGSAATAGYIDLGAGSRTFTVYDGDAATDLLISAGITSGALVKAGAGNLTITGAASYTGTTTISAGVLQIGDSGTAGALSPNAHSQLGKRLLRWHEREHGHPEHPACDGVGKHFRRDRSGFRSGAGNPRWHQRRCRGTHFEWQRHQHWRRAAQHQRQQ
jgi:autotransporter-associated beta strand protein